jgi:hypothetical protein
MEYQGDEKEKYRPHGSAACFLTVTPGDKKTGHDKCCHASVHENLRDSRRKAPVAPSVRRSAFQISSRPSPFCLRENGSCSFGAAFADSPRPFIRLFNYSYIKFRLFIALNYI